MTDQTSVLVQLKHLDEQRASLLQGAKKEALAKAQAAVSELNALGYAYEVRERGSTGSSGGSRAGTRTLKDAPCPICRFKTAPLHDGRRHKQQGDAKAPFTGAELKELGYTRVS